MSHIRVAKKKSFSIEKKINKKIFCFLGIQKLLVDFKGKLDLA